MNGNVDFVVYRVLPDESTVKVHAESSIHAFDREAAGVEGRVELALVDGQPDLSRPVAASVEISLADLTSGNIAYDGEMLRRLEVRRYPKVLGTLTGVVPGIAEQSYRVTGNITFHGVTRAVETDVDVAVSDTGLTAEWEQVIDIRDFNLKPPRILMFRVAPEIRVEVHLVAQRR